MTLFKFTFERPHPENPEVTIRFIIEVPYVAGDEVPDGSVLQTHIKWLGDLDA